MARSGETYKRLDKGIYAVYVGRKKIALRANVRVHGVLHHSPRYGPTKNLSVLKAWQDTQRVEARKQPAPAATAGFAADAARYLKAVAAMASYTDRERDIDAWVAAFGATPRERITSADISTHLAAWRKTLSASTVNHRRTALLHLWHTLDGKQAANPAKASKKYPEPAADDRSLDYVTIAAIFATMRDTVTKARLMVLAYTGLPHVQMKRLTLRDLDLKAGVMVPPGRRKGAGSRREAIPLTKEGIAAFEALARHKGIGTPFSNSSLHKAFRRACDAVQEQTGIDLSDATPYDLRHSWGARLYRAMGDERAVQKFLQHARIETTHRYTLGGVDARLQAVITALDGEEVPHQSSPPLKP